MNSSQLARQIRSGMEMPIIGSKAVDQDLRAAEVQPNSNLALRFPGLKFIGYNCRSKTTEAGGANPQFTGAHIKCLLNLFPVALWPQLHVDICVPVTLKKYEPKLHPLSALSMMSRIVKFDETNVDAKELKRNTVFSGHLLSALLIQVENPTPIQVTKRDVLGKSPCKPQVSVPKIKAKDVKGEQGDNEDTGEGCINISTPANSGGCGGWGTPPPGTPRY